VAAFVYEGPLNGGSAKVVDDADRLYTASLAFRTHLRLILCVARESAGCGGGAPGCGVKSWNRLGVRQCARHVYATPILCALGARFLCARCGVHPATSVTRRNAPAKSAPCSHGDRATHHATVRPAHDGPISG
jgi:hypothetical protein